MRRINDEGLRLIKTFEGLVDGDPSTPGLEPYRDPVGIPTIGYGSIWGLDGKRISMDHPAISEEQAEELLQRDTRSAERSVLRLIKVPLTDNQFSALVSFTYNVGGGNLQRSTLRMKLNRSEFYSASQEFRWWRRARGVILSGLVRRRTYETQLFLT